MIEINKPTNKNYWVATATDGSVVHIGETNPNQVTTTGLDSLDYTESDNEHLSTVSNYADRFDELPQQGELVEEDKIYRYNDTVIRCIQEHKRTIYEPHQTPALFVFTGNADGSIPLWSDFESFEFQQLPIGTAVIHEGTTYYLIDQGQGFREPGTSAGDFGWSTEEP